MCIGDRPSNIALNFMFIYDIRNKFILYLYRLSNGEYFLVADEFINVFYVIQSKMNPERVLLHPFRIVSIKIRYQSSDQFIFSTFRIALALSLIHI